MSEPRFTRPEHQRIARLLQALDAKALAAAGCLFGGGTAIALLRGEYRLSKDVDFLVSNREGYRALRERLSGSTGLEPILKRGRTLPLARDVRADQYGIRAVVLVDEMPVKFEIVHEARIDLDPPSPPQIIAGVHALSLVDMAATKMLANSDRGLDASVHARDLIDLATLALSRPQLQRAAEKARLAYGDAINRDLAKTVAWLESGPGRLAGFMHALQDTRVPAVVHRAMRSVVKAVTGAP